jgi:hypothetical protein
MSVYENSQKFSEDLYCEKCDYLAKRKSDFMKHLHSKKHNVYVDVYKNSQCVCGKVLSNYYSLYRHKKTCEINQKQEQNQKWIKMDKKWIKMDKSEKCPFLCDCGKSYKYQSGLSKHKNTCKVVMNQKQKKAPSTMIEYYKDDLKDMFIQLMEKNQEVLDKNEILIEKNGELMVQVTQVAKEPKVVNNNNTQFNVMNYLNNECKDAMNFTDFIDTFEFTIDDLHMLATKGYQETMEKTFIKQLKDMDKTKRPIHCSDRKRKSFYVKENGVWVKDDDNTKMVRGVKRIASRHFTTIHKWRARNPDCFDDDAKHLFFNNAMGQVGKCDDDKQMKKVINHLSGLAIKG